MSAHGRHSARSVRKSREAIIATFNGLVLNGHYAEIGIRELARKAGIGRSTFYEHFDDKTSLLVESMYPLLSVLADSAAGMASSPLPFTLAHFKERRAEALSFFQAPTERMAIESGVTKLIVDRLPRTGSTLPRNDVASTLARLTIGLIADWLAADMPVESEEFATVLARTTRACRSALLGLQHFPEACFPG